MANVVVLGTQWGDEGKGKIGDLLAPSFDVIARDQGGHNAGHTVCLAGRKMVRSVDGRAAVNCLCLLIFLVRNDYKTENNSTNHDILHLIFRNFPYILGATMADFNFLSTHVGSVPYPAVDGLSERLAGLLDVPAWPQLPRRSFRENMYTQYSPTLPSICEDDVQEKIYFDTKKDYTDTLEGFYTPVLSDDVDAFALRPEYAHGFYAMLDTLKRTKGVWAKGQVTISPMVANRIGRPPLNLNLDRDRRHGPPA